MKFLEALEKMSTTGITRENWPYYLAYSSDGYLTLKNSIGELCPYVLSIYDMNYDWKLHE